MEGDRLVIGFKNSLHYDRAEKKKEKILQIFKEMLHRDLSLEFSLHEKSETSPPTLTDIKKDEREKKREKIHRESMQHRVIQEAVKIFHGRVMEVREYS
jgi:RNase H-fold protein (predicted Holliday junction resolvase)